MSSLRRTRGARFALPLLEAEAGQVHLLPGHEGQQMLVEQRAVEGAQGSEVEVALRAARCARSTK